MFRRNGSECVATFAIDEVRVLRKVAGEVVDLLTDGFDHADPVVDRLFPDIYPEQPEDSAEFRLYTEGELKTGKIDQAGAILAALPDDGAGRGAPGRGGGRGLAARDQRRPAGDGHPARHPGRHRPRRRTRRRGAARSGVEPGLPALRVRVPGLPAGVPAQRATRDQT